MRLFTPPSREQDPFLGLYRDTDVEGMTDGWDDRTAYGHVLPTAMPGSKEPPLASLRLVARNSGLFYLGRHATLAPGWASPASLHARSREQARRGPRCG